jgi:hypothetical protein
VVGNFRNEYLRFHSSDRCRARTDHLGAPREFATFLLMILGHEEFQRGQHANHFFLVDLHAAANRVAVGRAVHPRRRDERFPSQQQSRTLRSADALAA